MVLERFVSIPSGGIHVNDLREVILYGLSALGTGSTFLLANYTPRQFRLYAWSYSESKSLVCGPLPILDRGITLKLPLAVRHGDRVGVAAHRPCVSAGILGRGG